MVLSPADMYSTVNGKYIWNDRANKFGREEYLKVFKSIAEICLNRGFDICIAEVLPTVKEVDFWKNIADLYNTEFVIKTIYIDPETSFKSNTHDVPFSEIKKCMILGKNILTKRF